MTGYCTHEDAIKRELASVVASVGEVRRHFTDHPLIDEANEETYVIYKMWGRNTEQVLTDLAEAFPDAGVTFRPAGDGPERGSIPA